jgi:AcrR family transcriptional regulator
MLAMAPRRPARSAPARAYHHGNLRQELLEAAMRAFAARGNVGFTLRELARDVGVTHNAPYRHFASKAELLQGLRDEGFRRLAEAEHAALRRLGEGAPVRARVAALGDAYVRYAIAEPLRLQLMLAAPLEAGEDGPPEAESYSILERTLEEGRASGEVRSDLSARELALVAWALVHGLASLISSNRIPGEEKRIRRYTAAMEAVFFDGAASRATRRAARAYRRPVSQP